MYVEYDSTRFLLRFLVAAAFGALDADLLGVFAMVTRESVEIETIEFVSFLKVVQKY